MKAPIKMMFPLEMYVTESGDILLTQTVDGVSRDIALSEEQAVILSGWLRQAVTSKADNANAGEVQHA